MIYAAETPTSGEVIIAGRNVDRLRESAIPYLRRNIGVVFQEFRLLNDRRSSKTWRWPWKCWASRGSRCGRK
jgi:ABC-type ATPase involved in cell division